MNSLTFFRLMLVTFLTLGLSVQATSHSRGMSVRGHHGRHNSPGSLARSTSHLKRRCKARNNDSKNSNSNNASQNKTNNQKSDNKDSGSQSQTSQQNNQQSSSNSGAVIQGLLDSDIGRCGPSGATAEVTQTSGPNGNIDFLNCGIDGSGWNPPKITVDQLKTVSLDDAIKSDNSPFKACSDYIQLFDKHAYSNGLTPIMLASIAMQESNCQKNTVGGAGEQGLMQLTPDKCNGAADCKDPDFNIKTGAKYFKKLLDENDGNVLVAIGSYNGWEKGKTTISSAKAWRGGNCRTQNNLDYIFQSVNGWYQNKNVYDGGDKFGKFFNLKACGN